MKISCLGVSVTVVPRVSDLVATAFGRFTFPPDSIIAELVIMKMINNTRKMSVNGVMLISATMPESSPPLPPRGVMAIGKLRCEIMKDLCYLDTKEPVQVRD